MKYSWILLLFGSLLFASCAGDQSAGETPSGFKFVHHVKNTGATPQIGEYAYFHVDMRNPATGEVTYSSHSVPQMPKIAIPDPEKQSPSQRPSPVVEALPYMAVGDSLTVFQSLDSIPRKPQGYEAATDIAFDIVLVEIKSADDFKKEMEEEQKKAAAERERLTARVDEVSEMVANTAADYTAGKLADQLVTTASGLKYIVHEEGTGPMAKPGDNIQAQYYGTLTDGSMFDNSFARGQAFTFPLGQGRVISGWDEGFGLIKEGSKATLFIPSELAYGAVDRPKIPGGSELIFYVELEKVGL